MEGSWITVRWRHRRRRLWVVPALSVLVAVLLAWFLPAVDVALAEDERTNGWQLLRYFDSGAMAGLLPAVASGMIAFTGLVFTAVVLSVQFGTSSLSPRLIPLFQRDRVLRLSMGVFTATFVYAVLIAAHSGARTKDHHPLISSAFAVLLTLASVVAFIALVHRVVELLRVVRLLRRVSRRGHTAVNAVYPRRHDDPRSEPEDFTGAITQRGENGRTIKYAGESGVLLAVNRQRMVRLAARWQVRLRLLPAVGDFVADGTPVIEAYGDTPRIRRRALQDCLLVREERTLDNDPEFSLRVLSDVAIKALSPAVNDPTTAVQALNYIEDLLIQIGNRYLGTGVARDADAVIRLRYRPATWEDHVALAIDEIRHYGAYSVQVLRRLRALLTAVEQATPPSRHPALRSRLAALDATVDANLDLPLDRALARQPDAQGIGSGERTVRSEPALDSLGALEGRTDAMATVRR